MFLGIVLVLVVVALAGQWLAVTPPALTHNAALESATCARMLAEGNGFRTNAVYPLAIGLGLGTDSQPLLSQGPFFPALLSAYFSVRGEGDLAVRLCSMLALFVCLGGIITLGTRLAGLAVGVIAGLVLVCNPTMVELAISGTPYIWAAAWFVWALAFATWLPGRTSGDEAATAPPRTSPWSWLLAALTGLCMGLCYLSEPASLALILVLTWVVWRQAAEGCVRGQVAAFLFCFLVCAMPWWVHNTVAARNPLFSLNRYAAFFNSWLYPGTTVLNGTIDPGSPYLFIIGHPSYALSVVARNLTGAFSGIPMLLGGLLLPLAVAGFVVPPRTDSERVVRRSVAVGLLLLAIWTFTVPFAANTYLALLPAVALIGTLQLFRFLSEQPRWARGLAWCVVALICIAPTGARRLSQTAPGPSALKASLEEIAANLPADVVLLTDVPGEVAWYGKHTGIALPASEADMEKVMKALEGRPVGMFFTPAVLLAGPRPELNPYQRILLAKELPEGLTEIRLKAPGGRLFAFGERKSP